MMSDKSSYRYNKNSTKMFVRALQTFLSQNKKKKKDCPQVHREWHDKSSFNIPHPSRMHLECCTQQCGHTQARRLYSYTLYTPPRCDWKSSARERNQYVCLLLLPESKAESTSYKKEKNTRMKRIALLTLSKSRGCITKWWIANDVHDGDPRLIISFSFVFGIFIDSKIPIEQFSTCASEMLFMKYQLNEKKFFFF